MAQERAEEELALTKVAREGRQRLVEEAESQVEGRWSSKVRVQKEGSTGDPDRGHHKGGALDAEWSSMRMGSAMDLQSS